MKTESVKEASLLVQLGADYGLTHASVASLALVGAVLLAGVFATLAVKYRWV